YRADSGQIFSRKSCTELGCSTHLRGLQHQDIRDAVDDHTYDPGGEVQDDHDGLVVIFDVLKIELDAHVDDGHDDATQVSHTLDEGRNIGNTRHALAEIGRASCRERG